MAPPSTLSGVGRVLLHPPPLRQDPPPPKALMGPYFAPLDGLP